MTSQSNCSATLAGVFGCRKRLWVAAAILLSAVLAAGLFLIFYQRTPSGPPKHTLIPEREISESGYQGVTPEFFSPDSKLLFTGMVRKGRGTFSLWDLEKKEEIRSIEMPRHVGRSVSFAPRGDLLAVTSGGPSRDNAKRDKDDGEPREVRLYSFPDLKEVGKIESDRFISSAVLSSDGKLLATASEADGGGKDQIVIWDVPTRKPKHTFSRIFPYGSPQVLFSPDGKNIAYSNYRIPVAPGVKDGRSSEDAIGVFDVDSGKPLHVIWKNMSYPPGIPLNDFDYFPDGQEILVKWKDLLRVYNLQLGTLRTVYKNEVPTGRVRNAVISSDSKWLVFSIDDSAWRNRKPMTPKVVIWDLETIEVRDQWDVPGIGGGFLSMALSPDKKTLAIGATGLHLYDLSGK